MAYPGLLRQAGANGVDLLFAPTYSTFTGWGASDTTEATVRTIEHGFALVRPTGNGPSLILDPEGRVIASQDYFSPNDGILTAAIPTVGVTTVYSRIGDLFAYLCVLGVFVLGAWGFAHRRQPAAVRQLQTA